MGPANDFGEGVDHLLLVVDETFGGGEFAATRELADIPGILGKQIVGALVGCADELVGMLGGGGLEAIESAAAEPSIAGINQGPHLQQNTVTILQRADNRSRVAASEKMAVQRGEGPLDVATEKCLGGFEEISFRDVRREFGDGGLRDGLAFVHVGGEFTDFFDQQSGIGPDAG